MDKDDYQHMAECIRSGQVPESAIVEIMREDPLFEQWYRDRYSQPAEPQRRQAPPGGSAEPS